VSETLCPTHCVRNIVSNTLCPTVYVRPKKLSTATLSHKLRADRVMLPPHNTEMIGNGPITNKLTTFSSIDAKLKRLLLWYQRHENEILPIHQECININQLRSVDISKMRYSEKKEWTKALTEARIRWRKYRKLDDKRQQPITKFFKRTNRNSS
jgi:hypothetical protein